MLPDPDEPVPQHDGTQWHRLLSLKKRIERTAQPVDFLLTRSNGDYF
jgi:hypothetical protein